MRRWAGGALAALAVLAPAASLATFAPLSAGAQDTIATARHLFALDLSRAQPYTRSYDMLVHAGDSVRTIGQREVTLSVATYAGEPAWLLVELRSGIVPSAESLFVAPDLRPMHWSSTLGGARLGAEFSGDSIFGATSGPLGKRSFVLGSRPDLLVSTALIEAMLALLPLDSTWADSGAVLIVDAGSATIVPAELSVIGRSDTSLVRPGAVEWIVGAKTERGQLQLWVDSVSGAVTRVEQPLPPHTGSTVEFRLRPQPPALVPP